MLKLKQVVGSCWPRALKSSASSDEAIPDNTFNGPEVQNKFADINDSFIQWSSGVFVTGGVCRYLARSQDSLFLCDCDNRRILCYDLKTKETKRMIRLPDQCHPLSIKVLTSSKNDLVVGTVNGYLVKLSRNTVTNEYESYVYGRTPKGLAIFGIEVSQNQRAIFCATVDAVCKCDFNATSLELCYERDKGNPDAIRDLLIHKSDLYLLHQDKIRILKFEKKKLKYSKSIALHLFDNAIQFQIDGHERFIIADHKNKKIVIFDEKHRQNTELKIKEPLTYCRGLEVIPDTNEIVWLKFSDGHLYNFVSIKY